MGLRAPAISWKDCIHCGLTFRPRHLDEEFCCSGCRVVHDLIEQEGFSGFYDLVGNKSLVPLNDQPTRSINFEWLEIKMAEGRSEITLKVANLTCTACVWLIERLFRRYEGALDIGINLNRSTLTIHWAKDRFDLVGFARELHRFGYPISEDIPDDNEDRYFDESRALLTRLGVTGGLALNTMAFTLPSYLGLSFSDELAGLFRMVAFASASLALLVGGSWFFQRAIMSFRAGVIHMDMPISIGLIAAYSGSIAGWVFQKEELLYFDFVATFVTLMLLGRWLHVRMIEHNRTQLKARERSTFLIKKQKKNSEDEPDWEFINPREIRIGDILEIGAGSILPVNSSLLSGSATVSFAWITGEPDLRHENRGKSIPAGAGNSGQKPFVVQSDQDFKGSLIEKMISAEVLQDQTHYQRLLQSWLVIVIVTGLVGSIYWWFSSQDIARSLQVLVSVLVVSCPCAIGLALPLVDEIANARMRRFGIFIRKNTLWKHLPGIQHLVFDKTGTLTESTPKLKNPEVLDSLDSDSLEALAILIQSNVHPFGAALREVIISRYGEMGEIDNQTVEEVVSCGMRCQLKGQEWRFGKSSWAVDGDTKASIVLSRCGLEVASFDIGESVRDGAIEAISNFLRSGLTVDILSGDPDGTRVAKIASKLGISPDRIHFGKSTEEKAEYISGNHPERTLFVGDGGNDCFALDTALCSGSPATGIRSVESRVDFVFMDKNFRAVERVIASARRRKHVVRLIFGVAITYNVVAVGFSLSGMMTPILAAILMPLSSVVTVLIAGRT